MKLDLFISRWSPWRLRARLKRAQDLVNLLQREANAANRAAEQAMMHVSSVRDDLDKLRNRDLQVGYSGSDRDRDIYTVAVKFSPRLLGYGAFGTDTLDMVAESVSRQIAREIRKAKFLDADRPKSGPEGYLGW